MRFRDAQLSSSDEPEAAQYCVEQPGDGQYSAHAWGTRVKQLE